MINLILISALTMLAFSCGKDPKTADFSDDYVLIEFAAKLEEDYYRLHPQSLDNHLKESTK